MLFCLKKSHALPCGFFILCSLVVLFQLVTFYIVTQELLSYYCNDGIAFGVNIPQTIFVVVWLIIMGILLFNVYKERNSTLQVIFPYTLIISGALSNVIDRFVHGCVVDYIAIIPWNVFNLADAAICIGAIMLLWNMRDHKK